MLHLSFGLWKGEFPRTVRIFDEYRSPRLGGIRKHVLLLKPLIQEAEASRGESEEDSERRSERMEGRATSGE
jgi:hypothetical protein